ncbi:MAG: AAA family ATPase [Microthrixaceae bacterium]
MAVGRGDEIRQLRSAVQRGCLVVVSGGVGMGKTTLVQALEPDAGRVLTGQSLPCTSQRAYQPILNALSWAPVSLEPPLMADRVRQELGAADTLVLEDVQWSDEGTLAVLVGLAGHCGVVLTVEPSSSTAQMVRRLGHSLGAEFIDLRPLGPSESRELVDELRPDLMLGERQRLADASGEKPDGGATARQLVRSRPGARGDDQGAGVGGRATLFGLCAPRSPCLRWHLVRCHWISLGEIRGLKGAGLVTEEPDGFIGPTHRLLGGLGPGVVGDR